MARHHGLPSSSETWCVGAGATFAADPLDHLNSCDANEHKKTPSRHGHGAIQAGAPVYSEKLSKISGALLGSAQPRS